uniref:Ig-like domain-containing protein n=1 Tax=Macrostomum lignano TaxID=282301 RepID=A0A1I8IK65_9PLAT
MMEKLGQHQSRLTVNSVLLAGTVLMLNSLLVGASDLSVQRPMPRASAVRGSSVTLECGFQPTPEYIIWSFAAAASADWKTIVRCQNSPVQNCGSTSGSQFSDSRVTANGTMELPEVDQRHNGSYKCEAYRALDTTSTQGSLTV